MRHIWVDQTKLIAALAVISIHASTGLYESFANVAARDWWFANMVMTTGTALANPIFVMLSGYLLLGRQTDTITFLKSKAKRLFPAILFWSIFYAVFSYLFFSTSLTDVLWQLTAGLVLTGKAYFHLWYLSMFVCLMCITPFINQWIGGVKPEAQDLKILLGFFALLMLMNSVSIAKDAVTGKDISWFTNFAWYLTYFIAGHFLGKSDIQKSISTKFLATTFLAVLALCIGGNYFAVQKGITNIAFLCANNGILGFILALSAFCLFTRMTAAKSIHKSIEFWSTTSFGIYLIHPAILYFVQVQTAQFVSAKIPLTIASILLTFVISALLVLLMRKTSAGQLIT